MIEELMVIGQSLYERWAALERSEDELLDATVSEPASYPLASHEH